MGGVGPVCYCEGFHWSPMALPFHPSAASSKAQAQLIAEAKQYMDEVKKRQIQKIEPDEEFIQRGLRILKAGNSNIKTSEQLIKSLDARIGNLNSQIQAALPLTTNGFRSSLDDRIALAQSQGFVWNKNSTKPSKKSTMERKLSEWENNFKQGRNFTDFGSLIESDFDSRPKAFISGVCEAIEQSLGIEKPSQYLRPRFRALLKQYAEQ